MFDHLEGRLAAQIAPVVNEVERFDEIATRINSLIDPVRGGIEGAPKFPNAPFMDNLWLSWLYGRNETHRDNFLLSLKVMLQGGIYDHLGGGLCRYSTDANWLVPHFEKCSTTMLNSFDTPTTLSPKPEMICFAYESKKLSIG